MRAGRWLNKVTTEKQLKHCSIPSRQACQLLIQKIYKKITLWTEKGKQEIIPGTVGASQMTSKSCMMNKQEIITLMAIIGITF